MKISEKIKKRLEAANKRYWANDNISEFIEDLSQKTFLETMKNIDKFLIDEII